MEPVVRVLAPALGVALAPALRCSKCESTAPWKTPWFVGGRMNQKGKSEEMKEMKASMDKDMERAKTMAAQMREQQEVENQELKIRCARLEVDVTSAKKALENTSKQLEESEEKNGKLAARVRLGEDRMSKALKGGKTRMAELRLSFKQAAPGISDLDAEMLAHAIDVHEDFSNPESLNSTYRDGELHVYYRQDQKDRGWRIRYTTIASLPEAERKALNEAVEKEIKRQHEKFPSRQLVKQTIESCLCECFEDGANLKALLANLKSKEKSKRSSAIQQTQGLCQDLRKQLSKAFDELKAKNIDVEGVLLDSWQPLVLHQKVAQYDQMARALADAEGVEALPKKNTQEVAIGIYDVYYSQRTGGGFTPVV